jgi:hypothetical protein
MGELNIHGFDFVKVDIEGSEKQVFSGLNIASWLKKVRVDGRLRLILHVLCFDQFCLFTG